MIENEMNMIEEVNEEKIVVLADYKDIVKNIVIVPVKTKYSTFYNVQISFKNADVVVKTKCDNDLVNYISLAKDLKKGGVTEKALLKEENLEKQRSYTCVKFVLANGKVFRYFVSRADESTIGLLSDAYNESK